MFSDSSQASVGDVMIVVSNNGGHPPEFWAKQASDRIVGVANSAHPAIREQANSFKEAIESVVLHYMKRAIECDRATVGHLISEAGHPQLAEHVRRV